MLHSEETDEVLMSLYQGGSEEAFRMLYDRHSGKIFGYLKSRVGSEEFAADLFQDVFIKIHKSKSLYNKSLPVLPWFFSITQSVMIDGLRHKGRKKEIFGQDLDQVTSDEKSETQSSVDIIPLINKLPKNQKTAVQMRYVDEKTFEEIATALKTSPVNVRQMMSRSVRQLKVLLKGEKS